MLGTSANSKTSSKHKKSSLVANNNKFMSDSDDVGSDSINQLNNVVNAIVEGDSSSDNQVANGYIQSIAEKNHDDGNERPSFYCKICSKNFKWEKSFRKHMSHHRNSFSSKKKFHCDICGKTLYGLASINAHADMHSDGNMKHKCDICGNGFRGKHGLSLHMKNVHKTEEDKPFQCEMCNKRFKWKQSLSMHRNIHTKEKVFDCHICFQQFNQKGNLKTHLLKKHNEVLDEKMLMKTMEGSNIQSNAEGSGE